MACVTLVGAVLLATAAGTPVAAGAQRAIFLVRHAESADPEPTLTQAGHH